MSADTHTPPNGDGPFARAAAAYYKAGWRGILPLPHGQKKPVPKGYTGGHGAWVSYPDVQAWIEDCGNGNIALRVPEDVLGIDVDHYADKPGGAVLAALETRHGTLPATWRTTSRDDGTSGIRLYRIPPGLKWPGILGPGIETIRYEHRYAVVWPSIHPQGGTYRWINPAGVTVIGDLPTIDDLPALPDAWVTALTGGVMATDAPRADLTRAGSNDWLTVRAAGSPCRAVDKATQRGVDQFATGVSRHDAALSLTHRLAWLAAEGHPGVGVALDRARAAFLAAVQAERAPGEALPEWERMLDGAIARAAAANLPHDIDPCTDPFHGLIKEKDPCTTTNTTPTPATAATAPASSESTTPASPAAAPDNSNAASPPADPDDDYELTLRRNQAAAEELERLRARQAAQRLLEQQDEEQTIADRVRRRILDDKATLAYKRVTQPPSPPFDAGRLADILARPADPPMRADGLIPWNGSALVVAQRKTGKTTLLLNYARALITGEPFLGTYPVIPLEDHQRVAFLNYEVSAAQLARWAADTGVDPDRLFLVNLRGRRNPLGHPDDRAELAAVLREQHVASVIVDPFGRAYTGESQNDNGEVQAFLIGLDQFAREEVGALDLMLATHAGWDGERTRGASALEDWGDVIITLTSDEDDKRFMKAIGRDVDVSEDELRFDEFTRTLTRSGEGGRNPKARNLAKIEKLATSAATLIADRAGLSKSQIRQALADVEDAPSIPRGGAGNDLLTDALKHAERLHMIRIEHTTNGLPNAYYPVGPATTNTTPTPTDPTDPDRSSTDPGIGTPHHHSPTLYGSGGGDGSVSKLTAWCTHCGDELTTHLPEATRAGYECPSCHQAARTITRLA